MLGREARDLASQRGIFKAGAKQIEQVVVPFDHLPSRTNRIVIRVAGHHGNIPTLHDTLMRLIGWTLIISEPIAPDEIAFERYRPLLILGGKHQAADLRLGAVEPL